MTKHNRNKSNRKTEDAPIVKYELPEQQMKIEKFIDENGFPPEGELKPGEPPVYPESMGEIPVLPPAEEGDIAVEGNTLEFYKNMIQEVNVSVDLSRTELNELGHVAPYSTIPNFPIGDGIESMTFQNESKVWPLDSVTMIGDNSVWKKVDGPSEEQKAEFVTGLSLVEESPDSLGAVGSSQPEKPIVITLPQPSALVYKPGDSEVVKAVESQPVKNNGMATSPPGSTGPKKGYLRHTAPAKREK